jgi:ABC-type molybdate transport system substrate-binding protein
MRSISIIGFLGILLAVVAGCSRQSDQEVVVYARGSVVQHLG